MRKRTDTSFTDVLMIFFLHQARLEKIEIDEEVNDPH